MSPNQHNQIQSLLIANAKAPENNATTVTIDIVLSLIPQIAEILNTEKILARHQPCGCQVCYCEDEYRCQGCGAHRCNGWGTGTCVFDKGNEHLQVFVSEVQPLPESPKEGI